MLAQCFFGGWGGSGGWEGGGGEVSYWSFGATVKLLSCDQEIKNSNCGNSKVAYDIHLWFDPSSNLVYNETQCIKLSFFFLGGLGGGRLSFQNFGATVKLLSCD